MYRSSALQTCHCVLSRPKVFSPEYETYKKPSSSLSKCEPLVSKCCSALPAHSGPVTTRMPCMASGNAQNWTCDRGAHRAVHDKNKGGRFHQGAQGAKGGERNDDSLVLLVDGAHQCCSWRQHFVHEYEYGFLRRQFDTLAYHIDKLAHSKILFKQRTRNKVRSMHHQTPYCRIQSL